MKEKMYPTGLVKLDVIDKKTGKILETRKAKNLIVNSGRNAIAGMMNGGYQVILSRSNRIHIGTNGTAPTVDDTGLTADYMYKYPDVNASWDDTNKRWIIYATFTDFTETINICEAGLWTYYSNVMYDRVTFSSIEMTPDKNLKVTFYLYA